ncbi:MAG: methyltransferase domain-containing protein [Actinobacteria bacterium]|nr:methyltransferase domain-containing protein [Actinomycetota bacterium]
MSERFTNAEAASLSGERLSFSFGDNWVRYLQRLDEHQIRQAEESLAEALGGEPPIGKTFLDVGCGSGLFSLCAARLGAATIVSMDIDPASIACAKRLRGAHADSAPWSILQGSVLDQDFVAGLEPADIVYSWGVLHHTGAMWDAIDRCLRLVAPGGQACIALYNRPNHLRSQLVLKRTYNRLPRFLRPGLVGAYAFGLLGAVLFKARRNPIEYVRAYGRRSRGMSFWRDVEDWLGGLPFEWTEPPRLIAFVRARGFEVDRVVTRPPGGNNEYLLRQVT